MVIETFFDNPIFVHFFIFFTPNYVSKLISKTMCQLISFLIVFDTFIASKMGKSPLMNIKHFLRMINYHANFNIASSKTRSTILLTPP